MLYTGGAVVRKKSQGFSDSFNRLKVNDYKLKSI